MERRKRGRPAQDDQDFIKHVLLSNKERLITNGKLRGPTDEVWRSLKEEHDIEKSPKALYTCVLCDRWNLKSLLGLKNEKLEEEVEESLNREELDYNDNSTDNDDDIECFEVHEENKSTTFQIYIPKDKWNAIQPEEHVYRIKAQHKGKRKYTVLKPGIWADVLNSLIWESIKWPCSWSFKGNYISVREEAFYWLIVRAKCSCGNSLRITCPNPPPKEPNQFGLILDAVVTGTKEDHEKEKIRKRPLKGEKRRTLGEDMIDREIKASRMMKEMASNIMDFGDPIPGHLPSNEVGRRIRNEALKRRRLDEDPLEALILLKYSKSSKYMYSVREIGLDPFFVHLVTPDQLKIYRLYCKNNYSRIIIDATGSIVKKLRRPGGSYSGHIFLYLGVIRIPGPEEGLIPVIQMLSERHNSNAIMYWLPEWIRAGAPVPQEVVLDDSAALISAVSRAFGGEPSTFNYVNNCFHYLEGNEDLRPTTLIRIDVSHLTNLIRKWPELRSLRKKTKEFYIRSILLMAKATTWEGAKAVFFDLAVTALSQTEGLSVTTGEVTICEMTKKRLLKMIAGEELPEGEDNVAEEGEDITTSIFESGVCEGPEGPEGTRTEVQKGIKAWISQVVGEAEEIIINDGDRDNIMYSPSMLKKITHLLLILPLWSNSLARKMGSPYLTATGSFVENEIGQLKNNLIKKNKRIDEFIIEYLQAVDGSLKVAMGSCKALDSPSSNVQTNIKACLNERIPQKEEKTLDAGENIVENWRGLALPTTKKGYYWQSNPDFPNTVNLSGASTRLGIMKNGLNPSSKAIKIQSTHVILSNTCSFDAACQLFAAAYSDSDNYRSSLEAYNIENTILNVSISIFKKGVHTDTYKKRAQVISQLKKKDLLKGGILKIDCAMDCSSLLRALDLPPSIKEEYHCSSPFCPHQHSIRSINVTSVITGSNVREDINKLELLLAMGDVDETSLCQAEMASVEEVPDEFFKNDPEISMKGPLCNGRKTKITIPGPHLLVEVVGETQRPHSDNPDYGVQETVVCSLDNLPRRLTFKGRIFYLRGVIEFRPPTTDSSIGHYVALCFRPNLSWEIYDDLRDNVSLVDGKVDVNIHVILFTV